MSRRELPRRRLGLRRRARGSGTPDAVTRPRQRPWQGLGTARNERPSVRAAAEPQRAVQKARWAPYRLSKSKDSISHAPDTAEKKAWTAAHLLKSWALNRSLPPEAGPPITREETSSLASQPASVLSATSSASLPGRSRARPGPRPKAAPPASAWLLERRRRTTARSQRNRRLPHLEPRASYQMTASSRK